MYVTYPDLIQTGHVLIFAFSTSKAKSMRKDFIPNPKIFIAT